jgi:hypothetical protein
MCSISPLRNATLVRPDWSWFLRLLLRFDTQIAGLDETHVPEAGHGHRCTFRLLRWWEEQATPVWG